MKIDIRPNEPVKLFSCIFPGVVFCIHDEVFLKIKEVYVNANKFGMRNTIRLSDGTPLYTSDNTLVKLTKVKLVKDE